MLIASVSVVLPFELWIANDDVQVRVDNEQENEEEKEKEFDETVEEFLLSVHNQQIQFSTAIEAFLHQHAHWDAPLIPIQSPPPEQIS